MRQTLPPLILPRVAHSSTGKGRSPSSMILCRRIEEDVRLKRSIELIGQRRKMETHIKALNTAIRREIETYKDAFRELKDHYHAQVGRIAQAERLLGTALSVKSLEIRKREAVSMRTVIDKDTEARAAELIAQTEANCLMLKGLNSRFDRDTLKVCGQASAFRCCRFRFRLEILRLEGPSVHRLTVHDASRALRKGAGLLARPWRSSGSSWRKGSS